MSILEQTHQNQTQFNQNNFYRKKQFFSQIGLEKSNSPSNILQIQELSCQEKNQEGTGQQTIQKIDWTKTEQLILIQKHREIGNKWASISQYLNGKNDNCVKNHFYSKLRKMIRKLNRVIQIYFKKAFKTIPNATIYKLVEASQQRFKQKPICIFQVSIASQDVISKILSISVQDQTQSEENPQVQKAKLDQYKELIQQINKANKNYKKKSKKIKNSTIKAPVRSKKSLKKKTFQVQFDQHYSADESQNQSEIQPQILFKNSKQKLKFQHDLGHDDQDPSIKIPIVMDKKVEIKEGDQMQQLLKNIGLLHEGKKIQKDHDKKSERGSHSIKSFSDFQNPSECLSFFDDSNNCWKKQTRMFTCMNKRLFGGSGSEVEGL